MIGFGKFGKRNLGINSLSDNCLAIIDPTQGGFYDNVLNYTSENDDIRAFIEAIREVQDARLSPFYRPTMDPSLEGDNVRFKKGNKPAVGNSFNFWKQKAKEMPAVEGRKWRLGTEYQYYTFLVYLINNWVQNGWDCKTAIEAVVLNSNELGHYWNSKDAKHDFEETGSREVCNIFDLANTCKLLACSNEEAGGLWVAGGYYDVNSSDCPLADLYL